MKPYIKTLTMGSRMSRTSILLYVDFEIASEFLWDELQKPHNSCLVLQVDSIVSIEISVYSI